MKSKRILRVNSLLKEVISDIINKEVKNPLVAKFVTIISVDVSADLHHAKVSTSIIGTDEEKKQTIEALNSAAGFIAVQASKLIVIRYFPSLTFILDNTVENQMHIEELLNQIHDEQDTRDASSGDTPS